MIRLFFAALPCLDLSKPIPSISPDMNTLYVKFSSEHNHSTALSAWIKISPFIYFLILLWNFFTVCRLSVSEMQTILIRSLSGLAVFFHRNHHLFSREKDLIWYTGWRISSFTIKKLNISTNSRPNELKFLPVIETRLKFFCTRQIDKSLFLSFKTNTNMTFSRVTGSVRPNEIYLSCNRILVE